MFAFLSGYYRVGNIIRFNEEKSYSISVLILLLMFLEKIPKHRFLKVEGELCTLSSLIFVTFVFILLLLYAQMFLIL